MPRPLRVHVPGGFYHVTLRGNHRSDVFVVEHDRLLLNKIVARAIEKFDARLHAYCWMRNHLHLLMQVGSEPLAHPMRSIAAEFARAMQAKLATTGHFFERRYHANLIDADSYLLEVLRYIHRNPLDAGIVAEIEDFQWSSHHAYVGSRNEPWVTTSFLLGMFSSRHANAVSAYSQFVARADPHFDLVGTNAAAARPVSAKACGNAITVRTQHDVARRAVVSLDDLIAEACRRFGVASDDIDSPARDRYLSKVRAWIAYQAVKRRVATFAKVARRLGRDESTLRQAIRENPTEVE
jgi:putative transposase